MPRTLDPEATYRVTHDGVGGHLVKGDLVPRGTFYDDQLNRLLDLGAIEALSPEDARKAETEALERRNEEARLAGFPVAAASPEASPEMAPESEPDRETKGKK